MTITDVVNKVITQYGKDILLDGTRFCSIINDLAPKMQIENKIIKRLNQENLLVEIYRILGKRNTSSEDVSRLLVLLRRSGFSEEWIDIIFDAFDFNKEYSLEHTKTPTISNYLEKTSKKEKPTFFNKNKGKLESKSLTTKPHRDLTKTTGSREIILATNAVKCNGLYYHKYKSQPYYHCIKFYPDGRVIDASVTLTNIDGLEKVASWLKWDDNSPYSKGYYNIDDYDFTLTFDTSSSSGTVHYEGYSRGSNLILNSHSYINNNDERNLNYQFFSIDR